MRATVMYGAVDVRVEDVPDAQLHEPTDAVAHVTRAARSAAATSGRTSRWSRARPDGAWGTSSSGVVEEVGDEVRTVKQGTSSSRRSCGRTAPASSAARATDLLSARRPIRRPGRRRRPGRGRSRAGGRRDAGRARLSRTDDALMPSLRDAVGRDVDRPPRGARGAGRAGQDGRGRGRRGGRAVRRDRVAAARCRTDHPPRPAPSSGPHSAREFGADEVVEERGEEARRARPRADGRLRRPLGARVRRRRAGDRDRGRASRARVVQSAGSAFRRTRRILTGQRRVLEERLCRRRACTGARVHRGAAARRARGTDRARPGLRPDDRSRRRARWLPRDERP